LLDHCTTSVLLSGHLDIINLQLITDAGKEDSMKRQYLADISPGDDLDDVFYLRELTARVARTGKPFLALVLSDRSGNASGRIWDTAGVLGEDYKADTFVRLKGTADSYQGRLQLNIHHMVTCDEGEIVPEDFLPSSYRDRDELADFLRYFITEVYDLDYHRLLESFFGDAKWLEGFCLAPGDARTHHAYLGGLLEHTVSVATLCQHIIVQHPRLNGDLLITAAMLHDIGKIREYDCRGSINYSREGQLIGHVLLGQQMIEERIRELDGFPREKELQLVHALISHHGELEWGAPKRPQSAEALVLHHLDNLDAKVKGFFEVVAGSGEVSWPELQNLFRRPLDLPMAAEKSA
jgi:3'-5' exoribonuclease